ncbi:MAG: 5'-methylthioadenosine/adenosylhomocysteine nucleosidase [Bacilli bacterium]|nr:5'-methylthioadenosine/adenosylhomocysteine nucleosidase [Bacilli bacterium]
MSKVGIIFAMKEELDALKKYLELENEYEIFNLKFYEGKISDVDVVLVQSGIGKVNAARTTQILIDNIKVDYIFNIGVAGGLDKSLSVGDIVIGEKLVQHDFDITAFGHNKGFIPEVGDFIDADPYLINLANEVLLNDKEISVKHGVIASGDIFCTESWMSEKINKKFNALACEMEGASIAQVCYLCHIPFLILRSISDVPNNNNVVTYEEFLEHSTKVIAKSMKKLLKRLKEEIKEQD